MSLKKELSNAAALEIAQDFMERTRDLCQRIEIAGSIRRKEPVVHDIDFAVIPCTDDISTWKRLVTKRVESFGGKVVSFGDTICDFFYRGTQINFFVCPGESSWGVTLMWATGPKGHTIGMNIKASKKGLLSNSKGIWTRDDPPRLIEAKTEEQVGKILDWKYKPPEARGKQVRDLDEI
jgi:DNA polymerase/3'-5' exonuclease PolX